MTLAGYWTITKLPNVYKPSTDLPILTCPITPSVSSCLPIESPIAGYLSSPNSPPVQHPHPSTHLDLPTHLCMSTHHSLPPLSKPSIHLSLHLPTHPPISIYPPISVCLPLPPSHLSQNHPSTYLCTYPPIHLSRSTHSSLYIYPSLPFCLHPPHAPPTHSSTLCSTYPPLHPPLLIYPSISVYLHIYFCCYSFFPIRPSLPILICSSIALHLFIYPSIHPPTSFQLFIRPLNYFSFQPLLHDWCNKGRGMCYPVCRMVHIKEPLLLIGKSSPCGGSGFPLSPSEWSCTICPTPYNRK